MFSLLIVDDEAIIADGLAEVFQDLGDPEFDVYKAYSAKGALEILSNTNVDVVLSDIHMPGMSGLELLKEIRSRWPRCRVVFLTGYAEFDYVYTAIQYEGVSYLLKTDSYDDVIEAVRKATVDLEDAVKAEDMLRAADQKMTEATILLRENYLSRVLGGYGVDQLKLDEYGIPLNEAAPILLLLGKVENLPGGDDYPARLHRLYRVQSVAERCLTPLSNFMCAIDQGFRLVWLIQYTDRSFEACHTFVKGIASSIQNSVSDSFGLVVSFALDDTPTEWKDIPERLADLRMLLDYRIGYESGMLLIDKAKVKSVTERGLLLKKKTQDQEETMVGTIFVKTKLEKLAENLEYGDRQEYFKCFEELVLGFNDKKDIHNFSNLGIYHAIALAILIHMNRRALLERLAPKLSLHKLMSAEVHGSWSAAKEYLLQIGEALFDLRESDLVDYGHDIVGAVKKYIADHLLEPDKITLVRLADQVHLNPSYLSRLFRIETGGKLSDYVAQMRIRKAKAMLEEDKVKIQDVSAILGYGTAANFTRFFRKYVGKTPQEYRGKDLI